MDATPANGTRYASTDPPRRVASDPTANALRHGLSGRQAPAPRTGACRGATRVRGVVSGYASSVAIGPSGPEGSCAAFGSAQCHRRWRKRRAALGGGWFGKPYGRPTRNGTGRCARRRGDRGASGERLAIPKGPRTRTLCGYGPFPDPERFADQALSFVIFFAGRNCCGGGLRISSCPTVSGPGVALPDLQHAPRRVLHSIQTMAMRFMRQEVWIAGRDNFCAVRDTTADVVPGRGHCCGGPDHHQQCARRTVGPPATGYRARHAKKDWESTSFGIP